MVCGAGRGKMSALTRHLDTRSVSQGLTEEAGQQKLSAQDVRSKLLDAHEANLLDEEDMDIFGLRPMTDPLNLVCCNACKKPIKASQYAAHSDFCKSLSSAARISMGNAVDGTPQRKERKKILNARRKKASSSREPRKFHSVNSGDMAAPQCGLDRQIQMACSAEEKLKVCHGLTPKSSDPPQGRWSTKSATDATKPSVKPVNGMTVENSQNTDATSSCRKVEVLPYTLTPLATKIYYSQRTHHLRTAIRHMFFESSKNESSTGFSNVDALQVYVDTQEHSQAPDQIPASSSEAHKGESSGVAHQAMMTTSLRRTINEGAASCNPDPYSFISNSGTYLSNG